MGRWTLKQHPQTLEGISAWKPASLIDLRIVLTPTTLLSYCILPAIYPYYKTKRKLSEPQHLLKFHHFSAVEDSKYMLVVTLFFFRLRLNFGDKSCKWENLHTVWQAAKFMEISTCIRCAHNHWIPDNLII